MKLWNKHTKRAGLLWLAFEAAAVGYVAYDYYDNNQKHFSNPNPHANFIPEEARIPETEAYLEFVKTSFNAVNDMSAAYQIESDIEMLARVTNGNEIDIQDTQLFLEQAINENSPNSIKSILEVYHSFLQDGKVSEEENKWLRKALTTFEPSQEFEDQQNRNNEEIRQALAQNERFRQLSSQWVDTYDFVSDEQAGEQFKIRHELAQLVSDTIRQVYGYESIPVYISNENIPVAGLYYGCGSCSLDDFNDLGITLPQDVEIESIQKGFIWLQNHIAFGMMTTYENFLAVIFEEARHSVDGEIRNEFENGLISEKDMRYQHAAMLYLNSLSTAYGLPQGFSIEEDGTIVITFTSEPLESETKIGKFFERIGNMGEMYWEMYQDYRDYQNQYLERTAKEFASNLGNSVEYDHYCSTSVSSCIVDYYMPDRPSFFGP